MPRKYKKQKKAKPLSATTSILEKLGLVLLFLFGAGILVGLILSTVSGDPVDTLACRISPMSCSEGNNYAMIILCAAIFTSLSSMIYSLTGSWQKTLYYAGLSSPAMIFIMAWMNFAFNFGR